MENYRFNRETATKTCLHCGTIHNPLQDFDWPGQHQIGCPVPALEKAARQEALQQFEARRTAAMQRDEYGRAASKNAMYKWSVKDASDPSADENEQTDEIALVERFSGLASAILAVPLNDHFSLHLEMAYLTIDIEKQSVKLDW